RNPKQRPLRRRRGRRRPDAGARRRAVRKPLRRGRAPRDGARLRRRARRVSAGPFPARRAGPLSRAGPGAPRSSARPLRSRCPPGIPKQLVNTSVFDAIAKRDVLLHHPFESFGPVADFVYRAAGDPDVLAIKQTLYRTTPDSPLAESLVSAAKAGKEVTVLI